MNWKEAEELCAEAAERSLGFGPRAGTVTLDASEIQEVASRAAYLALAMAGQIDGERCRPAQRRGPYPRFAVAVRIDAKAASESIIANDRRTLAAAIKAAERHERDQ